MTERNLMFRAWDTVAKRMWDKFHLFGETTCFDLISQWIMEFPDGKCSLERLNDVRTMQYTGMLDSKKKNICEGDIVEYSNSRENMKFNAEVVYEETTARFKIVSPKYRFDLHDINDYYGHITVIGNIFENPELLN
jgi:uncharacterized phage protein (TIGR01671 family)